MKKNITIAVIIASVFMISVFALLRSASSLVANLGVEHRTIMVGDDIFSVDVSDSEEERQRGLSGRGRLEEGSGMLFVYDSPRIPVFWMKDMDFPIDIIWISGGRVIGAELNIPVERGVPEAEMRRYSPPDFVDMALEVASGTVSRLMVTVGEPVSIEKDN